MEQIILDQEMRIVNVKVVKGFYSLFYFIFIFMFLSDSLIFFKKGLEEGLSLQKIRKNNQIKKRKK